MERRGAHPGTTEIARALVSMVFPCQKDELIRHAEVHQADAAVLAVLESMPEGTYASMADVLQRFEPRAGGTAAQGPGLSAERHAVTAQRHKTMARGEGVAVRGQTRDDAAEFADENAKLDQAGVPTWSRTRAPGRTTTGEQNERARGGQAPHHDAD
jgi:Protein of unknown function (DUF2795)